MSKKNKHNDYELPTPRTVKTESGLEITEFGEEIVTEQNAVDAAKEYYQLFSANKNLYRMIPSLIDGMKPARRRFYYSWWVNDGRPTSINSETFKRRTSKKVRFLSGKCMEIHPHSDSGVEGMIGREGQYFSNNVMCIIPQGNYGNLKSSDPASGRYIEAKMSEFLIDCYFDDFDKYCVEMVPTYDGRMLEPVNLPAKYPAILFNPSMSSIGNAISSNIPPFNVSEVLEATIKLIKDPKAKVLLIPDSPTGADIVDTGDFEAINKTGIGKMVMQASSVIDYTKNTIKFTSIPLQTKTQPIIESIIELRKNHTFDDIIGIDDRTKAGEVDLTIRLKPDANPDKVLDRLYKKRTGLRRTFPVGIDVIDDFQDHTWGVRDLLLEWIYWRRDAVRAMMLNNLQLTLEEQHTNDALISVFSKNNIDDAVKICRNSPNKSTIIEKLVKRFDITTMQADKIAEMKIWYFSSEQYERYKKRKVEIKEKLDNISYILKSDNHIDEYIIKQLEDGIAKYGRPRKSKVIKLDTDEVEEKIEDIDYILGVSESGFIKKIPSKGNTSIGLLGKGNNSNISVIKINNKENVLIVDSLGTVCKVPISSIPEMKYSDTGVALSKFFAVHGTIKALIQLPSPDFVKEHGDELSILFITKKGLGKQVLLSEFKKASGSKSGIKLDVNDEVSTAIFVKSDSKEQIIIYTNKGNGIRIPIAEVKLYSTVAKGLPLIKLDNEHVVNACVVNSKKKYLIYITDTGKFKLTEASYMPVTERNAESIKLITLSPKDNLVGIGSAGKEDRIIVYKQTSDPEMYNISDIPVKARLASAEKMIKLDRKDLVVAYKIIFMN